MQNAATVVVYEGAPNWPDNGRFWEIVEKYRVSIFTLRQQQYGLYEVG